MRVTPTHALDVQESLKILRFRFRRKVAFRPTVLGGVRFYLVDGKLRPESEVLTWAASGRKRNRMARDTFTPAQP